jgi:hypothetical protein
MEQQAIRRKRSLGACGGEWPAASGGSGAGEAPDGDLGGGGGAPGEWRKGVNEGTGRVALTPTPFDPGRNR